MGIPTIGLQFKNASTITEGADEVSFGEENEFPSSVEEYTSLLERMIAEPLLFKEKARVFKKLINDHHFPPGWNHYLDEAIRQLPSKHVPMLPKNLPTDVELVNNIVADWDAEVLGIETAQQTYARLILSYSSQLQKTEILQEQASNFLGEFLKNPSFDKLRRFLYFSKESVLTSH
jgi:hypothetical protein